MSESPKRIGKYEIVGLLGKGAMGTVYKGLDPVLDRFVAIKMISTNLLSESELKERFLREARAAAQLNHPNIVTVYEFASDNEGVFLAMELLEGDSLQELMESDRLGGIDLRINILEQICEGLGFAHQSGIVHRDLKPGNIHISRDRRVKLLDFGLARLPSSDMTATGLVMGTPHYMSPEQVNGESDIDVRSDVFSMGIICYEMLTGQKPFQAETITQTMFQIVQGKRQPLRNFGQVPSPLAGVIENALSLDRESRPRDATELLIELQNVRDESIAMAEQLNFGAQDATVLAPRGGVVGPPRASRSAPHSTQTVSSVPRGVGSVGQAVDQESMDPRKSTAGRIGVWVAVVAVAAVLAAGFIWMQSSGDPGSTSPAAAASPVPEEVAVSPAPEEVAVSPPQPADPDPVALAMEEARIREVLDLYVRALETEDMNLYRAAFPNVTATEQDRLEDFFNDFDTESIELNVQSVDIRGETATLQIFRQDQNEIEGQRQTSSRQQTFVFSKQGGDWGIERIE